MAVSYTEELLARAEAWAALPLVEKRAKDGLEELTALYSAITGEAAGTCKQCQYSDFTATVRAYTREATTLFFPDRMKVSTEYTLAPGFENEMLVHPSYGKVVKADNLATEDAEFFIANGWSHAFYHNGKKISATEVKEVSAASSSTETEKPAAKTAAKKASASAEKAPRIRASRAKAKVDGGQQPEPSKELPVTPEVAPDGGTAGPTE